MQNAIVMLYLKLQSLAGGQEGQDLVEYALLICLLCLAVVTGVNYVTIAITSVFSNISSSLA